VRITIEGHNLPGRRFTSNGVEYDNVQVAVQERRDPVGLVRGDAKTATWHVDVRTEVGADGGLDFRGPAVQGKRGDRFLYLTWGNVGSDQSFEMFRRAKLMLNRVDPDLVRTAEQTGQRLVARVDLTDGCGGPRCARVDPPAVAWSLR
jgi:hypothetical protein